MALRDGFHSHGNSQGSIMDVLCVVNVIRSSSFEFRLRKNQVIPDMQECTVVIESLRWPCPLNHVHSYVIANMYPRT